MGTTERIGTEACSGDASRGLVLHRGPSGDETPKEHRGSQRSPRSGRTSTAPSVWRL